MAEAKKKPIILYEDEYGEELRDVIRQDVDLSYLFGGEKELRSVKIFHNGIEMWLGEHYQKGRYFTSNPNDPKILNTANDPARPRGNISWRMNGGGNPNGKPKGTKNGISAKQACEKLGTNPAEFLAALVKGDTGMLKQHRIKDPSKVTVAQRMKAAEILLNKMVPNLKPAELGSDGEAAVAKEVEQQEERNQIQVYLPGQGSVSIQATDEEIESIRQAGSTEGFMRHHEKENVPYDGSSEDDVYVWTQDGCEEG